MLYSWRCVVLAALATVAGCNWVFDGGLPTGFVVGPTGRSSSTLIRPPFAASMGCRYGVTTTRYTT